VSESPTFDLELFLRLNAEYESKPIVPAPRALDDGARLKRAEKRATQLEERIGVRGKRLLEVGCGEGDLCLVLARDYDCDVVGVDIQEYKAWSRTSHPRRSLRVVDISREYDFQAASFDRIASAVVWEHVRHPYSALKACRELLAPDGRFYLRANLHRSSVASHRYREVHFPWSHLLFTDEVFEQFYRHIGQTPKRPSWVNALSYADYLRYFDLLGFRVEKTWLSQRPFDREFYLRFEDVLSRYPEFDLTLDFFDVILTIARARGRRRLRNWLSNGTKRR